MKIFINGRFYSKKNAKISVFDHGFLYGDGIYETMRSYNNIVYKIDEHISRFFKSAGLISLKIPFSKQYIKKSVYQTLKINKLKDAYIRMSLSRGEGEIGLDPALCPKPTFVIIVKKFKPYPREFCEKGIKIIIAKTRRNHPAALNPEIKSTNFLNNILAKIEAKNKNAFEAIMLNIEGFVTEGTISNIFIVKNNVLKTPSIKCGILDGITRKYILKIAKSLRIKTKESFLKPKDLYTADECFITNTSLEIMPVSLIDNKKIMVVGKITKELIGNF
ncbi:MAG: branched-chain-amino-acid transaminase [Elusimicrobia bacterium]|nr:branched-chain-amino-acid transaminase [Elusimicrobiota bacterium]